jgi:hypothetical protein
VANPTANGGSGQEFPHPTTTFWGEIEAFLRAARALRHSLRIKFEHENRAFS